MEKNKKILMIVLPIILLIIIILLIFAIKKPKTFTVKFDLNNDSNNIELKVKEDGTVEKPEDPKKEGYIFIGWTLNGTPYDFTFKIKKDMVLEAVWKEIPKDKELVTIKFDTDGGSTISNQVIEKGTIITKPEDPKKEDYEFIGWFLGEEEFNFDVKISKDIVLVAKWKKNRKTS